MKLRRPTENRSFGNAGMSARAAYRTRRARFQQLSWQNRIAALAFVSLASAVAAFSIGASPAAGLLLGLGVSLAAVAVLAAPNVLIMTAVLLGYAAVTPAVGGFYTWVGSGQSSADVGGGSLALLIAAFFATWISARYSRGRAWVTLALALSASVVAGMPLLAVFPSWGLNAGRLPMAVVLAFRCGGWDWLLAAAWGVKQSLTRSERDMCATEPARPATEQDQPKINAWLERAAAEELTATILEHLPTDHQIFHDLHIRKQPQPLPHLVLGPGGGYLLASVSTEGPITENTRDGVTVPGVALGELAATLMQQRRRLASALHVKQDDLSLLVVVHPSKEHAVPERLQKTLAVYEASGGDLPTGQVTLLSADALLPRIDTGFQVWTETTRAATVRRARAKLTPALYPVAPERAPLALVAALDPDGSLTTDATRSLDMTWMQPGARADINTSEGVLTSLLVVEEPRFSEAKGTHVVMLCVEEEWRQAEREGRRPACHAYPAYAVTPAR